jgi:hypothetical protein
MSSIETTSASLKPPESRHWIPRLIPINDLILDWPSEQTQRKLLSRMPISHLPLCVLFCDWLRKDIGWTDYGGSRSPERVGININNTCIINIYHHRDKRLDSRKSREELARGGQRRWVCVGDFNSHHSIWDCNGREPAGSWREVREIIDGGRLMIEPGTTTWKGGQSHPSSTIDHVIASNSAQVSMVEIATDFYTDLITKPCTGRSMMRAMTSGKHTR